MQSILAPYSQAATVLISIKLAKKERRKRTKEGKQEGKEKRRKKRLNLFHWRSKVEVVLTGSWPTLGQVQNVVDRKPCCHRASENLGECGHALNPHHLSLCTTRGSTLLMCPHDVQVLAAHGRWSSTALGMHTPVTRPGCPMHMVWI